MDFRKIPVKPILVRPVEPIELFHSLKVTDSSINNLWLGQGDALRDWDKVRGEADVGVILNTGAGKTLVGFEERGWWIYERYLLWCASGVKGKLS